MKQNYTKLISVQSNSPRTGELSPQVQSNSPQTGELSPQIQRLLCQIG